MNEAYFKLLSFPESILGKQLLNSHCFILLSFRIKNMALLKAAAGIIMRKKTFLLLKIFVGNANVY